MRPTSVWLWSGFAVGELLVMLSFIGLVIVCLTIIDLSHEVKPASALARREVELVSEHELPVGDEFLCSVRLIKFPRAHWASPYYVSHVRFACRSPDPSGAFLLDIRAGTTGVDWNGPTQWRIWVLRHASAGGDYPQDHVETVASLPKPFRRCVPADLRATGLVVVAQESQETTAKSPHSLMGFPLRRLASAIRRVAERDEWSLEDPMAFILGETVDDRVLTIGEQHALAQSLVYRLLDALPQEEPRRGNAEPFEEQ